MKKKDLNNLKAEMPKALAQAASDLKKQIASLKMELNMHQLKDLKAVDKLKKNLAQTLTILHQKQLLAELESETGGQPDQKS